MNVDYENAYSCIENMLSIRTNIEKEVMEIKQSIETLISSGDWSSLIGERYLKEVSISFNNFEQLLTYIIIYINKMNTSIDSYKMLEKQIISGISSNSKEQAFSESFGGI